MRKLLLFLFCIPFLGITQSSHTINTAGMTFSPNNLTINIGDTVNWVNTGGFHNVNATLSTFPLNPEGFGNSLGSGWTFTHVFSLPGTYNYQCDPHAGSGMTGVIFVNGDLFISEYGEGSGYNKYIEIYNPTATSVDLSDYQIWKVTNGGSWPEYTLNLSGNLADGDVYIIYHISSNIDPIISSAGDIAWSQASWNGDDAVGLAKNGVLIDVIGEDGPDPGNGWDVAGITDATKDHTLVRKCSVTGGNTNWIVSAGTDALNSEWVVLSQNDWSNIGQHTPPCQSAPVYGCTDSNSINYNSLATIDDGSCIYPVYGCTDTSAINYSPNANTDDGSCCFVSGCTDSLASNYNSAACYDDGSCLISVNGCTDSSAANYNPNANTDDGSCCFVSGCTDSLAFNYNSAACYDDGTCINPVFGCMNTNAMNFDSTANTDDGSCILLVDKEDLFFSEYGEGSSNNKYLEIYNSTSNPVNLSSYALTRVSNAPTTVGVYEYWVDFDPTAVILANDVYIIAHASADSIILSQADMTYSSLSNGDDGFALVYGVEPSTPVLSNEYIILDYVGDFNGDPGFGWDVAGVSEATKDHVLVRKCDINIGNTNWSSSAGTDSLNSEWTVLFNEDWSDIGQHTNPCTSLDIYGCTDSTALNYDPSATIDDSSCTYPVPGCMDATAFNYNPLATVSDSSCVATLMGCLDPTAVNYNSSANVSDPSSCLYYGCTDPSATNYDASAVVGCDASGSTSCCTYSTGCGAITGVNMSDVIHDRATFNWNDMNSATCDVDQIRIRYSDDNGATYSTKTMGAPVGNNAPALNTSKRILNLSASTTYVYDFKIWYQDGTVVSWHAGGTFTTAAICDNVTNVTASPTSATSTDFCWDSVSTYSFVRLQYREDVPGSSFSNIGGMGVISPTLCKTKNGITPGTNYRVMWRTWCNPAGGPYRSPVWDGPVLWTQPTSIRVGGGTTISNLDVYPNPSRDIFNVRFTSEDVQDLDVRIINVIGEVVYTEDLNEIVGEYTKQVNLSTYTKGVYFLEITTDNGVINKKIVLC